ncbi:multicopper oxidase domain-containing protein [Candidatus Binatia bacterium]|nr:multicopper oxidase domain-containing protein [Candidatus Binatia bacterium]
MLATIGVTALACGDAGTGASYTPPDYAEPVVLASENGVLEVTLFARQGATRLDTVATPVQNFLLFGYEVEQGTASNGVRAAQNLYPGPTLQVSPGETLIVHVVNELADLTIPDFYDPAFTPQGQPVPLYPRQLTSSPINLHTHGLHVSPKGNSDNVLLNIPAGYTNTYRYDIPADHPQGMYWYHSHRHTLTGQQTYLGLAGMLAIGRSDGDIPLVTASALPIRNMALQYNYVFDRKGGQAILDNPNWPQYVSTLELPNGTQLADGTYVPLLSPLNFWQTAAGTTYFTNWWAGPLSPDNNRGQLQFVPSNLQSFEGGNAAGCPAGTSGGDDKRKIAANPELPDHLRDVQYTVNGLFQPVLRAKPGQTEIWVLANVSDFAYANVTLTETATGRHPPIAIVGQDGNPFPEVHLPFTDDGTTLVIPPASRYAIAVTMPETGDLLLEMPPADVPPIAPGCGILYTNDGTMQPPAVLGRVSVDPAHLSYYDGFFAFPTQVLLRMEPSSGTGTTVAFSEGLPLDANTSFTDLANVTPDYDRALTVSGGLDNENASNQDPKAFEYEFNANVFPFVSLLQPRLDSVEQWTLANRNNDEHPIHIHVNDFQVMSIDDPVRGQVTGVQKWGEDNANLPAPITDPDDHEIIETEGSLVLRQRFLDFTGTYVIHCHRLNHEDNGLMGIVNVIPAVSSYAVATSGAGGSDTTVRIFDGDGDALLATVVPFPGWNGNVSVTMGDVDGDQILDLVAGKGAGGAPEIVVYSGAAPAGGAPFGTVILSFLAFDAAFRGGVTVAAIDVDGNALADNVVVGSGPGIESTVNVYGSALPSQLGAAPELFSTFSPYPGSSSGVAVATGLVDFVSGRNSIVTAPGAGSPAQIKTFRFDLFRPNTGAAAWCAPSNPLPVDVPLVTSDFVAFDGYTGGVSLATGWVAGAFGGVQSIVVGQTEAPGAVAIFSSGSALDGQPKVYLESPDAHTTTVQFAAISQFSPFGDAPGSGVRVATTSTVDGADVLVSGLASSGDGVRVQKLMMERSAPRSATLSPRLVSEIAAPGTSPSWLGGD